MDASEGHRRPIGDLRGFAQDFVQVRDPRVAEVVARERARGPWPDPWLSLNPSPSAAAGSTSRRDDASHGEYRTKRVDLEMDNAEADRPRHRRPCASPKHPTPWRRPAPPGL